LGISFLTFDRSYVCHPPIRSTSNKGLRTKLAQGRSIRAKISSKEHQNLINTFPYETPKADKNRTVNTSVNPERPVPDPKVNTRSEGSAFK
jgi:hypothetical protein